MREKAFLTPKDVGVLFGVSRATVYRYFQTGIVKAIKIRNKTFVRTSDLDKMFDEASPYKKRKYQIKEEHTLTPVTFRNLVCRLLLEKKWHC